MKTILLCISIIITMATSSPIWASDLAKLYPEKIVEAKNLYPLAKSFFTGPGSLPPGETLTPEMLKSPERQAAYYKFRRLLGLAIDAEYDISYLEEFGLKKAKRGYYVDFSQYPQWATVESLFLGLRTTRDLQNRANDLFRLGLSSNDIKRLEKYVANNNPYITEIKSEKQLLQNYQDIFKSKKLKSSLQAAELKLTVDIHDQIEAKNYVLWNEWGKNLLAQIQENKQRILLSYLQENLGSMAIGRAPISEAYLNKFANDLATGITDKHLKASLMELENRYSEEAEK